MFDQLQHATSPSVADDACDKVMSLVATPALVASDLQGHLDDVQAQVEMGLVRDTAAALRGVAAEAACVTAKGKIRAILTVDSSSSASGSFDGKIVTYDRAGDSCV
jgi:hypothetical protein